MVVLGATAATGASATGCTLTFIVLSAVLVLAPLADRPLPVTAAVLPVSCTLKVKVASGRNDWSPEGWKVNVPMLAAGITPRVARLPAVNCVPPTNRLPPLGGIDVMIRLANVWAGPPPVSGLSFPSKNGKFAWLNVSVVSSAVASVLSLLVGASGTGRTLNVIVWSACSVFWALKPTRPPSSCKRNVKLNVLGAPLLLKFRLGAKVSVLI